MRKKKRRLSRASVEATLDGLRTEVGRVVVKLAHQLEKTAMSVRDKLGPRLRPALGPWTGPREAKIPQEFPTSHASADDTKTGDTLPCPQSAESAPTSSTRRIRFEVRVSGPQSTEAIIVVGNHPSLGNWAPQAGLVLSVGDGATGEPVKWVGRAPLPGGAFTLEYKYVRKDRDGAFAWEDLPGNRIFVMSASSANRLMRDKASWR